MKKVFLFISIFLCTVSSHALRFESGDNVIIKDTVFEDLYVAGGRIDINAPVLGDLVIAGGTLNINDSIGGDILLAGGEATFNGKVGDDIRCAGGILLIKQSVLGHVVIVGGEITIDEGVTIGELMASGGNITLNGNVKGNAKCFGGTIQINGRIDGDADIRGGKININGNISGTSILAANTLEIGPDAAFHSTVRYWTEKGEIDFKKSLKNTEAIFDPSLEMEKDRWEYLGFVSFMVLLWYLGMALLMLMLLQYLFGNIFNKSGNNLIQQTWRSFGLGVLYFIGTPIAALIAIVTLIGLPAGLMIIFLYIISLLFATTISAIVITHWLNNRRNKNWNYWRLVFVSFGVFIVLKIISLIPVIGWFALFVIVCLCFGAVMAGIKLRKKE